jgi:hypothetical protein
MSSNEVRHIRYHPNSGVGIRIMLTKEPGRDH